MKFLCLLFCSIISLFYVTRSEAQDGGLVQLSGIIHNADTNTVVPYVTLSNMSRKDQYVNANHQGFFSMVVRSGDTIRMSAVGYHSKSFVVPQADEGSSRAVTVNLMMNQQVVELPVVTLYPWASIDEFNYAFMNLEIADDDYLIAKRNLSYESIAALADQVPRDAAEIQNISTVNRHIGLTNKAINQRFANPLFSPIAWGNFINQITKGKESRNRRND
jgi:hypothetical protein